MLFDVCHGTGVETFCYPCETFTLVADIVTEGYTCEFIFDTLLGGMSFVELEVVCHV